MTREWTTFASATATAAACCEDTWPFVKVFKLKQHDLNTEYRWQKHATAQPMLLFMGGRKSCLGTSVLMEHIYFSHYSQSSVCGQSQIQAFFLNNRWKRRRPYMSFTADVLRKSIIMFICKSHETLIRKLTYPGKYQKNREPIFLN